MASWYKMNRQTSEPILYPQTFDISHPLLLYLNTLAAFFSVVGTQPGHTFKCCAAVAKGRIAPPCPDLKYTVDKIDGKCPQCRAAADEAAAAKQKKGKK
jgi:hypothetical protein